MQYDANSQNPEMLLVLAKSNDEIAGIAKAKADCKIMWSIDVDVLDSFRGKGLAAPMVNMLTLEILRLGYIPYYFAAASNVLSTHVAVRAGYIPAWVHCYKTRLGERRYFDL
jgi:predicted GNAT family acetyltransferase